jgi:hypothetical protein
VSITGRAKSACEVLEDASLAGCFLFDNPNPYADSGPNGLLSNQTSVTIVSAGHIGQAISFDGTSYFQASSFTGLGISNQSFSVLLWMRSRSLNRTVVHVSAYTSGSGWCIPFVGISSNGSVVVQIFTGVAILPCVIKASASSFTSWTHVVETWSMTNGLRLYLDGTLTGSLASAKTFLASGVSNFVTLGNSRNGMNICTGGCVSSRAPGAFDGDIDDFRVYSRELTASEVNTIYAGQ